MKQKIKTVPLRVNIPVEMRQDLENKAERYGTDMSTIVKLVLRCTLKQI